LPLPPELEIKLQALGFETQVLDALSNLGQGANRELGAPDTLHLMLEAFGGSQNVNAEQDIVWEYDTTEGAVALYGAYALKFSYGVGVEGKYITDPQFYDRPAIGPVVQTYGTYYFDYAGNCLTEADYQAVSEKKGLLKVEIMPNLHWQGWYEEQTQVVFEGIGSHANVPWDRDGALVEDCLAAYGIYSSDAKSRANIAFFRVDNDVVQMVLDLGGAQPLDWYEHEPQATQSAIMREYLDKLKIIQEDIFGFDGLSYDPERFNPGLKHHKFLLQKAADENMAHNQTHTPF
jgi:hypothetical protein